MIRRVKLLGIAAESPASGARFVGRFWIVQDSLPDKDDTANLTKFYTFQTLWQPRNISLLNPNKTIDHISVYAFWDRLYSLIYNKHYKTCFFACFVDLIFQIFSFFPPVIEYTIPAIMASG